MAILLRKYAQALGFSLVAICTMGLWLLTLSKVLNFQADQIKDLLRAQTHKELASNDMMGLIRKVNSVANLKSIPCLRIINLDKVAFSVPQDFVNCESGIFRKTIKIESGANRQIQIELAYELETSLRVIFLAALILQWLLALIIIVVFYQKSNDLKKFNLLALQVAHDIRSPIAALEVINKSLKQSSEVELSAILDTVITRTRGIADKLLNTVKGDRKLSVIDLKNVIESIVKEKRVEFSHLNNFELKLNLDHHETYTSKIDPVKCGQVVSNLINNAVEAVFERPESYPKVVLVNMEALNSNIFIRISDNGIGMSASTIKAVLQSGVSTKLNSKTSGYGLGISGAIAFIKSVRGKFKVESKLNEGTVVKIQLKKFLQTS